MKQGKMLQEVMPEPRHIEFQQVDIPQPGPHDVQLKIMKIGICGSDIHVYHGEHPFTSYPVTQGHEVSAEITGVGSGVSGLKIGQKVTVQPQLVCGECHPCRHGKYNLCEKLRVMGFQATGMASHYFSVDEKKVTLLPDSMSFEEGAVIEPLAVAVHAIRKCGDVTGKNLAVIGAGPIGNLVAQTGLALGAARVLVSDVSDTRLAFARDCGITDTVNVKKADFGETILKVFGPDKADIIIDCAGNDNSIGQAIAHARKGSTIILVAVFAKMANVDLAVLNDHELCLNTSMMYRDGDYREAISLVEKGKIRLLLLVTKQFPFQEFNDAYQYIDAHRETTMKVLISVQE